MFANAGPSGEPMATPSICRYMLLLKLNSTEEVASCINSMKMSRGKGGFGKTLLLYRASAQKLFGTLPPLLNKPMGFITKLQ